MLWTRLAPDPLSSNPETPGGMSSGDVTIGYEIATDDAMRDVVCRGEAIAERAFGYSVHVDVGGMQPGRPYWYRFTSAEAASRIGRAVTLPAQGAPVDKLRFGFVSCSNYEHGYFSAYRHLTDENPEVVLFLGDYIYETIEENRPTVRRHSDGIESATPSTYRNHTSAHRLDLDLQRLHAEVPAIVTWDDHEVQNDYADRWSGISTIRRNFFCGGGGLSIVLTSMPVRPISALRPEGPAMRVYTASRSAT